MITQEEDETSSQDSILSPPVTLCYRSSALVRVCRLGSLGACLSAGISWP